MNILRTFTKVLANWLSRIIGYILIDQTGFIPGHNIFDNIHRTLNVIHFGKIRKLESVILSVDSEKVFDSVEVPCYATTGFHGLWKKIY